MALGHSLALLNFKCGFLCILIIVLFIVIIVGIMASISHYENLDCSFYSWWLLVLNFSFHQVCNRIEPGKSVLSIL